MRQTNIFRTHKHDHVIPREVMIRALKLSPGKDWTDRTTKAWEYLKDWALAEDERMDGPVQLSKDIAKEQEEINKKLKNLVQKFGEHKIPLPVIEEAYKLSPGMDIHDKRTKAYKFLKNWTEEHGKND